MRFIKTESEKVWIIEPEIHGDKRGYLFESYRKDLFEEAGLNLEFTREFDVKLDGEIELGDKGYLISVYEGNAEVVTGELRIEIDDIKKQMVYVDADIEIRACGNGRMNVRYCENSNCKKR